MWAVIVVACLLALSRRPFRAIQLVSLTVLAAGLVALSFAPRSTWSPYNRVSWNGPTSTGELAIRWLRSDPVVRVASLKLIDAVRRSWAQAQEMTHAPPCCGNGQVLDPPMPALRGRL